MVLKRNMHGMMAKSVLILVGGYYNYQGKSVESNEEVKIGKLYANFYKDEQQEVKVGVHVDYMNFKTTKNFIH